MEEDFIPTVIKNNTKDTYMVVINGDLESGKKIGLEDFSIIDPGESSDIKFRSINALTVYSLKDNLPIMLEGANGKSHWWKVSNGNHGSIKVNENGAISLDTSYHIPFMDPVPSNASEWGFKLEYLDTLLLEKKSKLPETDILVPTSKPEETNASPKTGTLISYLVRNHSPGDSVRILQAIQVRTADLTVPVNTSQI